MDNALFATYNENPESSNGKGKSHGTYHAGTNKKSEQRRHADAIKMKSESKQYPLSPRSDAYRAPGLKTDAGKRL